jgi:glycosyltransferase involved in cell wall biosynthesis
MQPRLRVLFTTPVLEYPPAGGPQLRIANSIKALARVCELDVVYRCAGRNGLDDAGMAFYRSLSAEFHVQDFAGVARNRYVRRLQHYAGLDIASQARFLLEHVRRRGIDTLWFGYGNISFPLMRRIHAQRPDLKLVCDTDSVWSRYVLRELPFARGLRRWTVTRSGRRKEREERAWVALCDVTTAVSEVDAAYYRSLAPEPQRVRLFSNVIDLAMYEAPAPAPAGLRRPAMILAGSYGGPHSPMCEAARWTLEQVLPRVRERVPEAQLFLVGSGSDRHFGALRLPGVTVTGKVHSALPYLRNVDVSLVPLKYESGTRFKILEAGACGVPVVSTTLGAEGLPVVNGEHLLIADDADGFADAIVRVMQDRALAARLAARCRELVARDYAIPALESQARAILGALALSPRNAATP